MKTIIIKEPGRVEITEAPKPVPAENELLIEMKYMALCNQHDWKVNKGLYQDLAYLEYGIPGFPGHEGAGIVVDKGAAVNNWSIGDRVALSGLGGPPLYSEYVTRDSDAVARVDSNVPLENVAMAELLGCVYRACTKYPDYRNKSVLVSGVGPGGLAAVQICKALGAREVAAVDIRPKRLDLARILGADFVLDANDGNAMNCLKRDGVDVVVECSGNKTAYRNAIDIARDAIVIFAYSEGSLEIPLWPLFDHELTIYNSKWLTTADLQSVVDLIAAGKIRTDDMISGRVKFEGYTEAVELVGEGEAIKIVMMP
ncbi:MAG: zinc-binding dehydrogenase [candidate division KSB1 bacterium]|jgi:2-desacetyl-2-hydroxyethyl bacteriochlorophyllide A dehydrogenase|nr:zinc-binding dehydrogenase [candidate division KSB1 bacterium]